MIEYEDLRKVNEPFRAEYERRFKAVLDKGWYIMGTCVTEFEQSFATYNQSQHCVGVGSGLDALTLALRCFDFPAGSEVLVPSNTFIATILSVLHAGLKPVLVEPDIRTYNIDPARMEAYITAHTVAILPVHLYGKCCAMGQILAIARQHQLKVVEDCAQAHGAMFKGQKAGTFGDMGAFSFYPTKNLGALGDGGGIITHSEAYANRIRSLRNYGSRQKYHNQEAGFNSRLDELQAAFLSVKLEKLKEIIAHKRALAALYLDNLREDFIKPVVEDGYSDVYHIFNIRHPRRDALRAYLWKNGVKTEIHYPVPPHRQQALQGVIPDGAFPISEAIHQTTLSLPLSFSHGLGEIERVIEVLNGF
jgi:dTDP-4-amino-4,6-dideoxygalactose transaminase